MDAPPENSPHWSRQEWDLINATELFRHKPAIMKKAENRLERLRVSLAAEISEQPRPFPPKTDCVKGQIARGENHKGFPFLSLDLPQHFTKTEFFTFRTLFWWGHYLGFSLILKGPQLKHWVNRLKEYHQHPACSGIFMASDPNPWEWEFNKDNFLEVASLSPDEIQSRTDTLQYLKLLRRFPVSDETFSSLDWTRAGVQSFRDLVDCVLV